MCFLNTVVCGAIVYYISNRRDSDVSLFDTFCISPELVSFSYIPSQIFSTLNVLKVIVTN